MSVADNSEDEDSSEEEDADSDEDYRPHAGITVTTKRPRTRRRISSRSAVTQLSRTRYMRSMKVELLRSPLHQLGLFSACEADIEPGEYICGYPGRKLIAGEWGSDIYYPFGLRLNGGVLLLADGTDHRPLAHMVNSCYPTLPAPYDVPNVALSSVVVDGEYEGGLFALSKISFSEELLASYHHMISGDRNPFFPLKRLVCPDACKDCSDSLEARINNRVAY
jgi:hypothetical protein